MRCQLRDVCGVRSGDKGDISDISLFADDRATYDALVAEVTPERVAAHFGTLVRGPVERYLVPNVLALKFVLHDALGGGVTMSSAQRHPGQDPRLVAVANVGRSSR